MTHTNYILKSANRKNILYIVIFYIENKNILSVTY